nr:MAG TPA: hypothetical protein [Caudoviricetes sp.]
MVKASGLLIINSNRFLKKIGKKFVKMLKMLAG